MKKVVVFVVCAVLAVLAVGGENRIQVPGRVSAKSPESNYYTVYEKENPKNIVFVRGDKVEVGDMYLSGDNKLYEIVQVNDDSKVGFAQFLNEEQLPTYKVKRKTKKSSERMLEFITRTMMNHILTRTKLTVFMARAESMMLEKPSKKILRCLV